MYAKQPLPFTEINYNTQFSVHGYKHLAWNSATLYDYLWKCISHLSPKVISQTGIFKHLYSKTANFRNIQTLPLSQNKKTNNLSNH